MRIDRTTPSIASAETVWKILSEMKWEQWNPIISELKDCDEGLKEGAQLTMITKDRGIQVECEITEMKENEHLLCDGSTMRGIVRCSLEFNMKRIEEDGCSHKTEVQYIFTIGGCFGSGLGLRTKGIEENEIEEGLANLIELAEAQERGQ